jgi:hypothetical protein
MYKIVITDFFKKQLKKLTKKDKKLKNILKEELINFNKDTSIALGMNIYKIRIRSTTKGKSGAYRLYIFLLELNKILTPICIYSKNLKENVSKKELAKYIRRIKIELEKLL